ncbi:MAG: ATPase [Ferruginibacter sp.]|nr:ATPase [Ferruginibacter sp.]
MAYNQKKISAACAHCGEPCETRVQADGKEFCCEGCKQVYLLLAENELCNYYNLDTMPGIKVKGQFSSNRFAYLDDSSVFNSLVKFADEHFVNVSFSLPQMHCSSCVYLLENLHRLEPAVISSRVNFQQKEVFISFDPSRISLRKLVELLAFIGYEPEISLQQMEPGKPTAPRKLPAKKLQIFRLGVAGFCFANIMMLSFPEYLSLGTVQEELANLFTTIILFLSLPVLLFCAGGIFSSAWKGLRQRYVNIDVPIAFAIIVTFARSYYEMLGGTGAGYLDSGSGIVFFMLIGRWFQDRTYAAIAFDHNYKSYFPPGATLVYQELIGGIMQRREKSIPVTKLNIGDRILVRHNEMIPADGRLVKGTAYIDYSYVNGENNLVTKQEGDLLYAGGKLSGAEVEIGLLKEASQSYITELWNNDIFQRGKKSNPSFLNPWSRYFTLALFSIAFFTSLYWYVVNPSNIFPALTAVLIVACPCSLLLSGTFTNGHMLRIFGRNKFFLRNASVIESLAATTDIVFDKTGTLTEPHQSRVQFHGSPLSDIEKGMLAQVSSQSAHPLSQLITERLTSSAYNKEKVAAFEERAGQGISGIVNNTAVRLGSAEFIHAEGESALFAGSRVNVEIANKFRGTFLLSNRYRYGIRKMINLLLGKGFCLHVVSGDNDSEMQNLQYLFGTSVPLLFGQLPQDKLDYIRALQESRKRVLMIGDGLNDAGALMQANTGIAINDRHARFTPACDAILDAEKINQLPLFLAYAKSGRTIIAASFMLSILYNIVGLSFAISASLSPLVAAILMPLSSISIVLFVTITASLVARKKGL